MVFLIKKFSIFSCLFISSFVFSEEWKISPGASAQDDIQSAMILAQEGDTIALTAGVYNLNHGLSCLLYTSPSPRDNRTSRMPSSA